MDDALTRIMNIGFEYVGFWLESEFKSGKISSILSAPWGTKTEVLYAFVEEKSVLYVGYTARRLSRRFTSYENPGQRSSTDMKICGNIKKKLEASIQIDIYALQNDIETSRGEFDVNVAAGLEKSIIRALEPRWNEVRT